MPNNYYDLQKENEVLKKRLKEKADMWDSAMSIVPSIEKVESKLIRERHDDLNIDDIRKLLSYYKQYYGKRIQYMYVYYDIGNGINETDKMRVEYEVQNDKYFARCTLPDGVKMIRVDLCESGEKMLYFSNLKINEKNNMYDEYNTYIMDGKHTFLAKYPHIIIREICKQLSVEFELGCL